MASEQRWELILSCLGLWDDQCAPKRRPFCNPTDNNSIILASSNLGSCHQGRHRTRLELLLSTGGPTVPGVCSSPETNEPHPVTLWMQYFIEIYLEGGLGLIGYFRFVFLGSSLS